jgi:hypothetical protein
VAAPLDGGKLLSVQLENVEYRMRGMLPGACVCGFLQPLGLVPPHVCPSKNSHLDPAPMQFAYPRGAIRGPECIGAALGA